MIKKFQVYYDSEGWRSWRMSWRIFPYYLGFENLLSSQLTDFSNAINSQCQHNDSFSLSKYLDVSQATRFRKFRFYLELFNNARSIYPGLFIANYNLLYDENHLLKDLNLKFDLDDPLLFSKIREELITINRVGRI